MTRSELQRLARQRVKEAKTLLKNKLHAGTYYLAGYAIECALKACIAKRVIRYEFPDRALAVKSHTHDLQELVKVAGLLDALNKRQSTDENFKINWAVVKDWSPEARYSLSILPSQAKDLYRAVVSRKHGVLPWLTSLW